MSSLGRPTEELMTAAAAQALLDQLSSPLARTVFHRKFVLGHSYQAIASTTPGLKDAKAVESLVYRERTRLQPK